MNTIINTREQTNDKGTEIRTNIGRGNDFEKNIRNTVDNIFSFILKNIYEDDSKVSWLFLRPKNLKNSSYQFSLSYYDLFYGMPGEILFFATYGKLFKNERALTLCRKAYNSLFDEIKLSYKEITPLGLYTGWRSLIFLSTKLGQLFDDSNYYKKVEELFDKIDFKNLIKEDSYLSCVKGTAGFINACSTYYEQTKSSKALEILKFSAENLLSKRVDYKGFKVWKGVSATPLSGFSHGASGYMLAYAKLYDLLKNEKYKNVVIELLKYEDTLFSEKEQNWQDKRDFILKEYGDRDYYSVGWAHGAGGIGLTRLELLKRGFTNSIIEKDAKIAFDTVLKKGFKGDASLSMGDFGNLELLTSQPFLSEEKTKLLSKQIIEQNLQMIKSIEQAQKPLSLGLMTGITGVGYQCLRHLYPNFVPSVLMP